jgi:thiamine biosynthesis lipoprotein
LILDEEKRTVFYSDPKLSLDLGAIAKGYVASVLYERFTELDVDNFLINLGGNVVSHGRKSQNEPWIIKIENPFEDKSLGYNEIIKLQDATVVTSGSYQRYFTYNEKQYSHIIDASNGYPADIFTSVSIQAPAYSSALADALSTALFCMSYEDGLSLIEKLENVEALWIFKDGSCRSTSNFGGGE